ncbi:hypothetical protein ACQUQU_16010 [Thalassolituus sp. LLYu03]|uniref:hypothetical protein n=1 Tax=Thalassolituus sp. LLYu03 TaxID=3421656 RepID=UPI003D2CA43B
MMNLKHALLPAMALMLAGCIGENASFEQEKATATEPANHSVAAANEFLPPATENGTASSGVLGELVAGEDDYYVVNIDYFDTGAHTFTLTSLTDDLDMTVTDWTGVEYSSEGSGTGDEVVVVTTSGLGYFSDDKPIYVHIYGKTTAATSKFRLQMTTLD